MSTTANVKSETNFARNSGGKDTAALTNSRNIAFPCYTPPIAAHARSRNPHFFKTSATIALIATLGVAGCHSPANHMNQITVGMSKRQVTEILGPPRTTSGQGDLECLRYTLTRYRPPLKVPLHEQYLIYLRSDHVVSFGRKGELMPPPEPPTDPNKPAPNINVNIETH